MIEGFINGTSLEELSENYNYKKTTISRHLKKNINEEEYKRIIQENNKKKNKEENKKNFISDLKMNIESNEKISKENPFYQDSSFVEISPLNCEIDDQSQKDFASVPISEIKLPKVAYMIVHKNIELETKFLRDFAEWEFLSENELQRKAIEIYVDMKNAKRLCKNDQKVIKVPNTDVFKIVAPSLISRGISRIVFDDTLISL